MDHGALSDAAVLTHGGIGINHGVFANSCVLPDIDMGIDQRAVLDDGMGVHDGERHDGGAGGDAGIRPDVGQIADAFREGKGRGEDLEQLRKSGPRVDDVNRGNREFLRSLR